MWIRSSRSQPLMAAIREPARTYEAWMKMVDSYYARLRSRPHIVRITSSTALRYAPVHKKEHAVDASLVSEYRRFSAQPNHAKGTASSTNSARRGSSNIGKESRINLEQWAIYGRQDKSPSPAHFRHSHKAAVLSFQQKRPSTSNDAWTKLPLAQR